MNDAYQSPDSSFDSIQKEQSFIKVLETEGISTLPCPTQLSEEYNRLEKDAYLILECNKVMIRVNEVTKEKD